MNNSLPHSVVLVCHPTTPMPIVRGLRARVCRIQSGALALTFTLTADLTRLCVPAPAPPHRAERLWAHTCFEAFVAVADKPAYYEFNLAPSGAWAVYAFRCYREGAPLEEALAPAISACRASDQLEIGAILHLEPLPRIEPHAKLCVGLSAIIEDAQGVRSYWALKHPSDKPDFHHRGNFALSLGPVSRDATTQAAAFVQEP